MHKNNLLVSIIMPVYNAEKYVGQSIESVLNQTHKNWELIIINDKSTDNSQQILLGYKDSRIKIINLTQNGGVANARNAGIEKAKGQFLAFLDSDDLWHPEKLSKQLDFMLELDVAFSYTQYQEITENNKRTRKIVKICKEPVDYKKLLRANYFGCLTVVLDTRKIAKPLFKKTKHEDYALWLDILRDYDIKAYGMNEVLAYYRITPGSISRNKFKGLTWNWKIYKNHLGMTTVQSVYRMCIFLLNISMKYVSTRLTG
ncbi:glycosyltransferase family 2 protein [Lysinibacillus xylanilyticus]|uniref:glycosyltransferase family 2 protein n=1 Tax=Lysinibacillus xylanilyticus TaxID=582475 RepID=UPI003D03A522